MSRKLYRSMVVMGFLGWVTFGMRSSDALRRMDAGLSLEPVDWFVLGGVALWAVSAVVALLQVPIAQEGGRPGEPAA